MKTNKTRLAGYVALLMLAAASHAGVMAGRSLVIPSPSTAAKLQALCLLPESVLIMAYRLRPHPYANCDGIEPTPVKPWRGVYNADSMMPQCMQPLRAATRDRYYENNAVGEDPST